MEEIREINKRLKEITTLACTCNRTNAGACPNPVNTGTIMREIRELEDQMDQLGEKEIEANMKRIAEDLRQIRDENQNMIATIKSKKPEGMVVQLLRVEVWTIRAQVGGCRPRRGAC